MPTAQFKAAAIAATEEVPSSLPWADEFPVAAAPTATVSIPVSMPTSDEIRVSISEEIFVDVESVEDISAADDQAHIQEVSLDEVEIFTPRPGSTSPPALPTPRLPPMRSPARTPAPSSERRVRFSTGDHRAETKRRPSVPVPNDPPDLLTLRVRKEPPLETWVNTPDEEALRAEGKFAEIIELQLERLERLDSAEAPKEKARLLRRIAQIFEKDLDDTAQSFDALVEALSIEPDDDLTVFAIERLTRALDKWSALVMGVDEALKQKGSVRRDTRLCELVAGWHTNERSTPELAAPYLARIRKLDPCHPLVQREMAAVYQKNKSWALAKAAYEKALDRSTRDEERVSLHIELGQLHEQQLKDIPEATRHYEAALVIDPAAFVALLGSERILREQERYAEIEVVLERQIRATPGRDAEILSRLRLGELLEKNLVRPNAAAAIVEPILESSPAHEQALMCLERCYLAMRSWADLVRTLEERAKYARDPSDKAEVMFRIAEVVEAKMGDAEGALVAYRRIFELDEKNTLAISELARLSEKKQDWAGAADYRSRQAKLAPDARTAAQIHVAIGDLLSPADRDPLGARLAYERAIAAEPSNMAAWEALQRDANKDNDERRIAYCLEQRAHYTESARLKAQLLVELARILDVTDKAGSFQAYESAIAADPSNEAAAEALLPAYLRLERWDDAGPVCELLVNAATRDGDTAKAFQNLRLATTIARATDDEERALIASLAAYDARPGDRENWEVLLDICAEVRENRAILDKAQAAVNVIAHDSHELTPQGLVRLAWVKRAFGDWEEALDAFGRVLKQNPKHKGALVGLVDLFSARNDWDHACNFKLRLARAADGEEASFKILLEAGEMWKERAKNLPKAAQAYEEALSLRPRDRSLLHTLLGLYTELKRWEKLCATLRTVVDTDDDAERKAKGVFAMAQVLRDEIKDPYRAAKLFEETIALDAKRLDAFERVVRIYTELKDWHELERSYRKMLLRAKDADVGLRYQLFHQLGLIYRDRMVDAPRAIEAFRAAAQIKPQAETDRKILNELFVVTNQLGEAVVSTRAALEKAPASPALYGELYDLFLRQHEFDKAWCAVNVLSYLGKVTPEQARFYQNYPPLGLSYVPGSVPETAWPSHLHHVELDKALTAILKVMTGLVTRVRLTGISKEKHGAMLGETLTEQHSFGAGTLLNAVKNASEILSCAVPQLHLRRGPAPALVAAMSLKPAMQVSLDATEALSSEGLAFLVGKRLAELRPDFAARTFFPTVTELATVVTTALRLSGGARAEGAQKSDAALIAAMTPEDREILQRALRFAGNSGGKLDVKRWAQLVDLSTTRAGLLLCGHVEIARRAMLQEVQSPCDLRPSERVEALMLFAVSDIHADLRSAIGVAVAMKDK